MTYRLDDSLFIENGAAARSAQSAAARPAVRFLPWRKLDSERRLTIIKKALNAPANAVIDGFPVAL
jgi:hypothetical protein